MEWADWQPEFRRCSALHTHMEAFICKRPEAFGGDIFNIFNIWHEPFLETLVLHAGRHLKLPDLFALMIPIVRKNQWSKVPSFMKHKCLPACLLIQHINIRNWETVLKMFYIFLLPCLWYVMEEILPLGNFCLCLLAWQELTPSPAFACHSPGNVTKCFSEVHFFPIPSCYFLLK